MKKISFALALTASVVTPSAWAHAEELAPSAADQESAVPQQGIDQQAPPSVQADNENAASVSGGIEEVMVTATRRSERLQDVPISVTALTSQSMEKAQINDVFAIQRAAPNVNIKPFVGDPTDLHVAMRGTSLGDSSLSYDQPVGLYVDGVYVARGPGGNFGMIDVERVEVLRGPQGTLFGRNTIGGAINLISRKPTDAFEGYVQGSVGNYDSRALTGVVNIPINDQIQTRLVVNHNERDGYAKSSVDGRQLGAEDNEFVRGSIRITPSDSWEVLLQADYTDVDSSPAWSTLVDSSALGDAFVGATSDGEETASQYVDPTTRRPYDISRGGLKAENWGFNGSITGEADAATFKSITAYRSVDRQIRDVDLDGTPYIIAETQYSRLNVEQFSQETQLYGKAFDKRLDWIVGAYFFNEKGVDDASGLFLYPTFVAGQQQTRGIGSNQNWSLFSQLTYSLTEKLRLTGGIRSSHDSRNLTLQTRNLTVDREFVSCALPGATAPSCDVALQTRNYSYTPFTVGIDYKPVDGLLLYTKFSRGFRSGGYNFRAPTIDLLRPFNPEQMDAYEAGFKGDFFDRRARLNLNFYYQDYSDIQILRNIATEDGGSSGVLQNVGTGRIYGVEGEAVLSLGQLLLTANFGTADSKYTKIEPGVAYREGESFPESPSFTGFIAGDYLIPVPFGSINAHLDYDYRTKVKYSHSYADLPDTPNYKISQSAYGTLNAAITAELAQYNVEVSLVGRNLTDERYLGYIIDLLSTGVIVGSPGAPRTFGINLKYSF